MEQRALCYDQLLARGEGRQYVDWLFQICQDRHASLNQIKLGALFYNLRLVRKILLVTDPWVEVVND
jgi:hypothetical protein